MLPFTLAAHGDPEERDAWPAFLRDEFPEYETFWQAFVVELTERVNDGYSIEFRPQVELDAIGRPEWHVAVAQLHYTTLLHLVRVFALRQQPIPNRDVLIEAIARLSAATDTAFELLGRCCLPGKSYASWTEDAGRDARKDWLARAKWPLTSLRDYRNTLLHGRARVQYRAPDRTVLCPSFEKMADAADWREADMNETVRAKDLVDDGWAQVLDYLKTTWNAELLPWANEQFAPAEIPPLSPWAPPYPLSGEGYWGGSITPPTPNPPKALPGPGSAIYTPRDGGG